ncbi:hypothetical protein R80B4_00572 [Fibrobacteres bacterium R8-0-B4]
MEALVIERSSLPEPLSSYITSELVSISKENGNVVLSPARERVFDMDEIDKVTQKWHKIFGDGRMSTEDFILRKSVEKTLEES